MAASTPFRGKLPYRMTYELTPPANMNGVLMAGLQYYRFGDKLEMTGNQTVLVHFDGFMVVDSGYEIIVDVTAAPIANLKAKYTLRTQKSLLPRTRCYVF